MVSWLRRNSTTPIALLSLSRDRAEDDCMRLSSVWSLDSEKSHCSFSN